MIETYKMTDAQILARMDEEGRECLIEYGYTHADGSFDFDRIRAQNAPLTSDEIDERLEDLTYDEIKAQGFTHPDGSVNWNAYYASEVVQDVDLNSQLDNVSEEA
ncbi:MAG: hypothetical protein AAF787_10425 [Chloroflexota bacterium]